MNTLFGKLRSPKRQKSLPHAEGDAHDATVNTPSNSKKHVVEVHPEATTVIDQDATVSSTAVAENLSGHWAGRNTASNPRAVEHQCSVRIHQEQLDDAPPKYQDVYDENLRQKQLILDLQSKLKRASIDRRAFKNDYFALLQQYNALVPECDKAFELRQRYDALVQEYHKTVKLRQHYNDLVDKYDKTVKKYDELDEKYLAVARTLQVTDDDQSTINRKLTDMRAAIEDLVTKGKGQSSVNLNRVATIRHFWDSELLQGFPVQEQDLEPFHLNLYIESVIAKNSRRSALGWKAKAVKQQHVGDRNYAS
ncbi:hypothetical protein BG003_001827 [Podila horticola]|nr:hypothetical protein BG003_001827 [Podila horticola]